MLRDFSESDFPRVLQLNLEWEHFLSPMDDARLRHIYRQAAYRRVFCGDEGVSAFLLALREGADYDSANYQWFAARYPAFLYVDRIAVSASCQRQGAASALYRDIFKFAAATSAPLVACEYDTQPPNEKSRRFHARFGFGEVGRQQAGGKAVSLQIAETGSRNGGG